MGCDADVEVAGFVAELLFSVTDNTSLPSRKIIVSLQLTVRVVILGLELRSENRTCLPVGYLIRVATKVALVTRNFPSSCGFPVTLKIAVT